VIGLMSGTSLDGLDIAYCEFEKNNKWKYKIIHAKTIIYTKEWKKKLSAAYKRRPNDVSDIDNAFGAFIANEVLKFTKRQKIKPDFISSHGHTVFHEPDNGITVQIGSGQVISALCKLPVVCDFRSGDVAMGGQGAPLVPLVDRLLFSEYEYCLNLGGFANISYNDSRGKRVAFDVCPVNIVLNRLANHFRKEFDRSGNIASQGKINDNLLKKLNSLSFYSSKPPKSLGREWMEKTFLPALHFFDISVKDKLRTVVEHVAIQVSLIVNLHFKVDRKKILITGGGVYNRFLMKRIVSHANANVALPDDKTIQFKEAMAFSFLGVLRMRNEVNILKSVTGAKKDSSGGKIYDLD